MIKVGAVINGAIDYAEHELLPKLSTLHRFAVTVYLGMLKTDPRYVAAFLEHPLISAPKLVMDDGCIDIDSLYAVVRDYVSRAPVTVSVAKASITLLPQDIDQLYAYIKESNDEG